MEPLRRFSYEEMPGIVKHATPDIQDHLWSLYWLVRHVEATRKNPTILEIGVRQGDSTRAFLCACQDLGLCLTSIDIEDCRRAVMKHAYDLNLMMPNPSGWKFIHSDSILAAIDWTMTDNDVDLLFLDTCHTYPETLNELEVWFPHMASDGIMCGHDYALPDKPRDGVEPSVKEFMKNHPDQFTLEVHKNCCGLFILWPIEKCFANKFVSLTPGRVTK